MARGTRFPISNLAVSSETDSRTRRHREVRPSKLTGIDLGLAAGFLLLLAINAYHYYPFLSDDALISLRYSQRLLRGQGLNWTSGVPVEGYTNLLWVLAVALIGKFGVDLILASRILGFVCTFVSALALLRLPTIGAKEEQEPGKLAAVALLGMSATTGVWAIGGLEQPMLGACLAVALLGAVRLVQNEKPQLRDAWMSGISLALMCLTRPDSPLFVVAIAGSIVAVRMLRKRPVDWRMVMLVAGIPFAVYGGQILFRHAYYGDWISNTARVKFSPTPRHFVQGLQYLYAGFQAGLPLYCAAILSLWSLYRQRCTGPLVLLASTALIWVLYVAVIGGDIFPAFRHFTPIVIISVVAISLGFGGLLTSLNLSRSLIPVAALAGSGWLVQTFSAEVRRAEPERFEWQGRDLALMLKGGFASRSPLLAVTAAGCLPYWTEFDCIDMLGLNDAYIPRHRPASFGYGLIGHELGSGKYIMARRPDLIIYNVGTMGDSFLTGKELEADKEFLADYTPICLSVKADSGYSPFVWMNRYSPRIGYSHQAGALVIPGYLVNGNGASEVVAGTGGQLEMDVRPDVAARLIVLKADLPAAPFAVTMAGEGSGTVKAATQPNGDLAIAVQSLGPGRFVLRQIVIRHANARIREREL